MTWLLFIDESGHDHKVTPLEVRGGFAIHVSKLWSFVQAWQRLELDCFGTRLIEYGKEIKGAKLLDKDRFQSAAQTKPLPAEERRKLARTFLHKGREKAVPQRAEFSAYGQACLEMARGVFDLLQSLETTVFACAIPRGTEKPAGYALDDYLRKDHVFLFERFFYFLESKKDHGLIVMDATEKKLDNQFVSRMESYFTRTVVGRNRSHWIVPAPLYRLVRHNVCCAGSRYYAFTASTGASVRTRIGRIWSAELRSPVNLAPSWRACNGKEMAIGTATSFARLASCWCGTL